MRKKTRASSVRIVYCCLMKSGTNQYNSRCSVEPIKRGWGPGSPSPAGHSAIELHPLWAFMGR